MAEDYAEPSIRMPTELNRRLRIAAAKEDMSRAELIRHVLREAVEELEDGGLDAFVTDEAYSTEAD